MVKAANGTIEYTDVVGNNSINSVDINPDGRAGQGDNTTVRFCDISGSENGIWLEADGVLIEENYIHNLFSNTGSSDPHIDGIQIPGSNIGAATTENAIIRHNNIDLDVRTANACITMMDGINVDIINNRLNGGSAVIYFEGASKDCDVVNNVFDEYAFVYLSGASWQDQTYSGNVDVTGIPLPINDDANGGSGNDLLVGDSANNRLSGGSGNDTMSGAAGNDIIYGNQNDDLVYGNIGGDTVFGGQGIDRLYGGRDEDLIYGNFQSDVIYGNFANDTMFGGQGDDTIYGGQGDDLLSGNLGNDALFGNIGADVFVFGGNSGLDRIIGFNFSENDRIALQGQTYTTTDTAQGLEIDLSGGGIILLIDIHGGDFSTAFFI